MNLLKKIKLFRTYKKVIKDNRNEIEQKFNFRVDRAYRLYTVLNVPEDLIGEAYTLKKSDYDRLAEPYIREFVSEFGKYLDTKELNELYDFYELVKVDKLSWKIVIGYKFFRSNEWYDRLYFRIIPIISFLAVILGIILYFL